MKRWFVVGRFLMVLVVFIMLDVACAKVDAPEKEGGSEKAEAPSKANVARVNGKDITMAELVQVMSNIKKVQFMGKKPSEEDIHQIKKNALDSLIFTELARQYAEKNIKVTEQDVNDEVGKLKTHLKTEEAYQDYLKKSGTTEEDIRKKIEGRLRMQKLFQQEVNAKAIFDEEAARKEYNEQKKFFTIPERIEVEDIYIHPKEDKEKAKKKAEDIAAELKEVKEVSKLKDKAGIGIKTVTLYKDRDAGLFQKLEGLQPEQISPIIEEKSGYHVFLVRRMIPEELTPFDKVKGFFQGRAKQKRAKEWYEELKKEATIEIMPEQAGKKSDGGKKPGN